MKWVDLAHSLSLINSWRRRLLQESFFSFREKFAEGRKLHVLKLKRSEYFNFWCPNLKWIRNGLESSNNSKQFLKVRIFFRKNLFVRLEEIGAVILSLCSVPFFFIFKLFFRTWWNTASWCSSKLERTFRNLCWTQLNNCRYWLIVHFLLCVITGEEALKKAHPLRLSWRKALGLIDGEFKLVFAKKLITWITLHTSD